MSVYFDNGSLDTVYSDKMKNEALKKILSAIGGKPKKILLLPPDGSRFYSNAGLLSSMLYDLLSPSAEVFLKPALGTHFPMTESEIRHMFGPNIPLDRFLNHNFRTAVRHLGTVPAEMISEYSEGAVSYPMDVAVNTNFLDAGYDCILSIGQIVPHEVIGMANYTKNICVGIGGSDMINKSHYLGAAYGMERIMGRINTPVRKALDYGYDTFIKRPEIHFIFTVMGPSASGLVMRGMFAGNDKEAFVKAAKLSQQVNLDMLAAPLKKAVVYLEPAEFKSTWLGNKAIYRLRMAMADDGELIILAPALHQFGEDAEMDRLIRKFGYHGTEKTKQAVIDNEELRANLGAAAHLIHGSSDGRFRITYCPGSGMNENEIRSAGFNYVSYETMIKKYNHNILKAGWNTSGGEDFFYVPNPALGLWALKKQFA